MNPSEFLAAVEEFQQKLVEHSQLWGQSLDQTLPEYASDPKGELKAQSQWLRRKLGELESELRPRRKSWTMYFSGGSVVADALTSSVGMSDVAQIKGPSMQKVIEALDQIIGRVRAEIKTPTNSVARIVANDRQVQKGKCFVVIASDKDATTCHEGRYRDSIQKGISDAGYTPIRNVDGHAPNWFGEMIEHLRTCECAVVDLTDMRPNCIWELGILHAWNVPVILVYPKDNMSTFPSDIYAQRISVFYDHANFSAEALAKDLKVKIVQVMADPNRGKFLPEPLGVARGKAGTPNFDVFERALLKKLASMEYDRLDVSQELHMDRLIKLGLIEILQPEWDRLVDPRHQRLVKITDEGKKTLLSVETAEANL